MSETNIQSNEDLSHVEPDDIGVGMLTVLGALVFVALILVVILLQAWFYNWKDALLAQRNAPIDESSTPTAIARAQTERIESYGWADAKKHIRTIPIDRAMELIVSENSSDAESVSPPEKSIEK